MKTCPKCKSDIADDATICGACGLYFKIDRPLDHNQVDLNQRRRRLKLTEKLGIGFFGSLAILAVLTIIFVDNGSKARYENAMATIERQKADPNFHTPRPIEEVRVEREAKAARLKMFEGFKIRAWVKAQSFVEDQLISPSTADFPLVPHRNIVSDDGCYIIVSQVDSQNEQGTMIRKKFSCELCTANGDNWTLKALNFY